MKFPKMVLLFGFLVWLIPFIAAFLIFPIKSSSPALFESIMPVVLTITVVLFVNLHLRRLDGDFLREGVKIGIAWFAMSWVLDLLMFMWGPMKMSLAEYTMDMGLTYIIIPTITIGVGYLIQGKIK